MTVKVPAYALPWRVYQVFKYMKATGSISAREAMLDLDMTSASLARRIVDLEERGYDVSRLTKYHPVNGRRYTRYVLLGE